MGLFGPSLNQRRQDARNNLREAVALLVKCENDLNVLASPAKCWDYGHTERFLKLFRTSETHIRNSKEEAKKMRDNQLEVNIDYILQHLTEGRRLFEHQYRESISKALSAFKEYQPAYEGYIGHMKALLTNSINGIKLIIRKNLT